MSPTGHPVSTEPPADADGRIDFAGMVRPFAFALAALLLGLAGAWVSAHFSRAIQLRPSPAHGAALIGGVLAAAAILRRPVLGLVALVLLVYLNLSDVLIRNYGLPSLLQLLTIPLLAAVLLEWRMELPRGLRPWGVTVALAAYVVVLTASSTVAERPGLADERTAAAGKAFVIYLLTLLLVARPGRARAGAWAFVAGGLVLAGTALVQVATGGSGGDFGGLARTELAHVYGDVREVRIAGPVGDPNFFAQILLIVFPIAFLLGLKERSRTLRFLALTTAAAVTAAVLFTYSRGGALALGVVVACCLFSAHPSRMRLLLGGTLLACGIVLAASSGPGRRLATLGQLGTMEEPATEVDTSIRSRLLDARVAWRMFLDHPALGVGAGNYTVHYYTYADEIGSSVPEYDRAGGDHYPHNLYLELAAETGLVGLIVFGTAILLVMGRVHRAEAAYFREGDELRAALATAIQIALLGYLTSSLFLHGHFQRYLWILLGFGVAIARMAPTAVPTERRLRV